jgi:hypothetical protein
MDKKFVYILLICFCLSFLGLSVHHHREGVSHDTCLFCYQISHESLLIPQNGSQISLLSRQPFFISVENALGSAHRFFHAYSNRSPPI